MKIAVYGVGNFGFAIIKHLSANLALKNSVGIFAYDRNRKLIQNLQKNRKHLYHHKDILIKKNVTFTNITKDIFQDSDVIILAVTSQAINDVINKNKKKLNKDSIIVNTAKALDNKNGERFSEIIMRITEIKKNKCSFAVLSGGTIASDLFHHEPLGVDIASKNQKALKILKKIFTTSNLNVYTTSDVSGVEYAGAFKNVISILAGIISGLKYSYGSETHFITRASEEVVNLIKKKTKIDSYTFSMKSQSWGNDLWLSCTGNTRNRQFGELIGRGYNTQRALRLMKSKHQAVEGINTIKSLKHFNITSKTPILNGLIDIIEKGKSPKKVIWDLMASNLI